MSQNEPSSQSNIPQPVPIEIKRLVASIVQFFGDQLSSPDLGIDTKESLEGNVHPRLSHYFPTHFLCNFHFNYSCHPMPGIGL